LLDSRKNHKKN